MLMGTMVDPKTRTISPAKAGDAGRVTRLHTLNDLVWRAVDRANVPAVTEPVGLVKSD